MGGPAIFSENLRGSTFNKPFRMKPLSVWSISQDSAFKGTPPLFVE